MCFWCPKCGVQMQSVVNATKWKHAHEPKTKQQAKVIHIVSSCMLSGGMGCSCWVLSIGPIVLIDEGEQSLCLIQTDTPYACLNTGFCSNLAAKRLPHRANEGDSGQVAQLVRNVAASMANQPLLRTDCHRGQAHKRVFLLYNSSAFWFLQVSAVASLPRLGWRAPTDTTLCSVWVQAWFQLSILKARELFAW